MSDREISLSELRDAIQRGDNLFLLDVREPHELAISRLPNVVEIPLGQVPDRVDEIPRDADIIVICRTGGRSGRVTEYLHSVGYERVRNMVGGMNGWATEIDSSMPTY